jgi:putative PIN family toxin of toxin-antitoxin system
VRVVLDTNVVVSAAFFGGPPRRVVDAWIRGRLQVALSPSIFDEYLRVCDRLGTSYPGTDYQPLLTALLAHGILVADSNEGEAITEDPDDDKFMRCASVADAIVVSGDRHLLDVDGWRGVSVATPAQLLARLSD